MNTKEFQETHAHLPWKYAYKLSKQKRRNPDIEIRDAEQRLVCVVPRLTDQKRQEQIAELICESTLL